MTAARALPLRGAAYGSSPGLVGNYLYASICAPPCRRFAIRPARSGTVPLGRPPGNAPWAAGARQGLHCPRTGPPGRPATAAEASEGTRSWARRARRATYARAPPPRACRGWAAPAAAPRRHVPRYAGDACVVSKRRPQEPPGGCAVRRAPGRGRGGCGVQLRRAGALPAHAAPPRRRCCPCCCFWRSGARPSHTLPDLGSPHPPPAASTVPASRRARRSRRR